MAINGKQFSFEDIKLSLAGKVVTGCTGVSYQEQQASEQVHVLGQAEPYATISGAKTYSGEVRLMMDEYDALQDSIPRGKSLTDIAGFEIVVLRLGANNILRTDVLRKVKFMEVNKEMSAGETFHEITLPISIAKIDYNV